MVENEIQNFNIMCGENLRNIMKQLTKDRGFSCISYHELRFTENGKTAIISKVEEFYYPHDYIAYYWAEFKKDGNDYRLTMFFKDFDHGTGNIHVLPGLFQLWKKTNNCLDVYFWINKERTADVKRNVRGNLFEVPHGAHGGGRVYCEANGDVNWVPCSISEGNYPYAREFYNVITHSKCAICVGKKLNEEFDNVVTKTDGFINECKKATESNLIYSNGLKKEVYSSEKTDGRGVYNFLKWEYLDNKGVVAEKTNGETILQKSQKIQPLYHIKYVENQGYFYVYGQNLELKEYDLNYSKTGMNRVCSLDDNPGEPEGRYKGEGESWSCPKKYYWKLMYEPCEAKQKEETP